MYVYLSFPGRKILIGVYSVKETNFIETTTYHESKYAKLLTAAIFEGCDYRELCFTFSMAF